MDKRRSVRRRLVIDLDEWDHFEIAHGTVLAVFVSGHETIELRLSPAKVVEGITRATKALIKGGVLPRPVKTANQH